MCLFVCDCLLVRDSFVSHSCVWCVFTNVLFRTLEKIIHFWGSKRFWGPKRSSLQHTEKRATHCNTLQHTATHCNTLGPPSYLGEDQTFLRFKTLIEKAVVSSGGVVSIRKVMKCVFFSFMSRVCRLVCGSHLCFKSLIQKAVVSYVSHVYVWYVFSFVTHICFKSLIHKAVVSSGGVVSVKKVIHVSFFHVWVVCVVLFVALIFMARTRRSWHKQDDTCDSYMIACFWAGNRNSLARLKRWVYVSFGTNKTTHATHKTHFCSNPLFLFEWYVSSCSWLSFMLQTAHQKSRRVFWWGCVC